MRIVSLPVAYAPAYRDVLFGIEAEADELVELDIRDLDGSQILGRRRLLGSTSYLVNVAAYARSQFQIAPLSGAQCAFAAPDRRIADVTVSSGIVSETASLCAGIRLCTPGSKLSDSPAEMKIAPGERDEIAILPGGDALRAEAVLSGEASRTITLASTTAGHTLKALLLSMDDIRLRLAVTGDSLGRYDRMEVRLLCGDEVRLSQRYRIGTPCGRGVRIAWWNAYGQIDRYTMRAETARGYEVSKQRILAEEGYRTTACSRESRLCLVSDYEGRQTMEWLSGMLASPKVWIERGDRFDAVDILSGTVVTSDDDAPCRLEIVVRDSRPEIFQNQ